MHIRFSMYKLLTGILIPIWRVSGWNRLIKVMGGGGGGGGIWGQKYMLSLTEITFHPGHNAFYRIQKSLPVLQIFTLQVAKIGPLRGKKRP